MRHWIKAILKSSMGIVVLMAAVSVFAQEVIKVGYLPQVHDAANFAVGRELGKKYKLEYVKFLRYADEEIALARGDIQIAPLGYATVVGSALRDPAGSLQWGMGVSGGAAELAKQVYRDLVGRLGAN